MGSAVVLRREVFRACGGWESAGGEWKGLSYGPLNLLVDNNLAT